MKKVLDEISDIKEAIAEIKTDNVWIKRIIIGAASLGFLEKIVAWIVGK